MLNEISYNIKKTYSNYFLYKSRSNRTEYFIFCVFCFFVTLLLLSLTIILPDPYYLILGSINLFFGFLSTIPIFSLSIRRLHDINCSGWWSLIIFSGVISSINNYYLNFFISILNTLFCISLFIIKGTSGTNKYGEEPENYKDML